MSPDFDVIVVGAGPVGSTLAWQLIKAGLSVCILELEPGPVDQLRASTFHPPTLDMLAADGITQELIAAGRITPTWQIRMHQSGERAEFDLAVLNSDTGYPYRLQCRQEVLVRCCLKRISLARPDCVRFNARVQRVDQGPTGVLVSYASSNNAGNTLSAAWVVGCDGPRSVVRESLGIEFVGDAYPEQTILATTRFPFDDYLDGLSGVNYIWADQTTFSLLRLPDVWRCSFHPMPGQTAEQALQPESIRQHLHAVVPAAADAVIEERRIYQVHHRVAQHYRVGRVFLAGDAAHLNSPKGGMGMNGGIHDAFELGDILQRTDLRIDSPILDRYERRRRPVAVDDIIGQSDQNRARMAVNDEPTRLRRLAELQSIAADRERAREFLLRSSMIDGLRKSQKLQ